MVGGTVVETLVLRDKVWVNVHEGYYHDQGRKPTPRNRCAIYVEKTAKSRCISEGDALWWQGGLAMWTPAQNRISSEESNARGHKCGVHFDIQLNRLGYSGVERPQEVPA